MHVEEPIEIRMLGSLRVRRSDHSAVHATEWRTGKTVDLLRLLALNAEQPVRIDSLLDKLWPEVAEAKGRASLRTAASQLRRSLRSDCIERRMGGLVLTRAWVDVAAFGDLAVEARTCHRSGDHAKAVGLTRQAEAMYLGDFEAHDGDSDWAVQARESLAATRVALLTDAVESAVQLRWLRDAVDLARLVLDADPYSDRGHRGLMRAYAGLGETDRALRVFADFRTLLDDELGISPSAQTQALQRGLRSGAVDSSHPSEWVGHEDDCVSIVNLVRDTPRHTVRVVCLTGAAGSGRRTVVDAALDRAGVSAVRLLPPACGALPSSIELEAAAKCAQVVVLPPLDAGDARDVAELVSTLADLTPATGVNVVVPVGEEDVESLLMELEMTPLEVSEVRLHPLTRDELERLASAVLCGPLAPGLVDTLMTLTDGLGGRATTELRGWLAAGRILWTPSGLDLASSYGEMPEPEIDKITRRILERVCPLGMDVLSLLALLDRPVTARQVTPLLDRVAWPDVTEDDVDLALDHLTDLGALAPGPRGYEFMHRRMRATTEAWLRHSVRRRLHRRIAESQLVPAVDRAGHRIKAADPLGAARTDAAASAEGGAAVVAERSASLAILRPDPSTEFATRAALLEEAVLRALEPLFPGAQVAFTLSVVPDVHGGMAIAHVACTEDWSRTSVTVPQPA